MRVIAMKSSGQSALTVLRPFEWVKRVRIGNQVAFDYDEHVVRVPASWVLEVTGAGLRADCLSVVRADVPAGVEIEILAADKAPVLDSDEQGLLDLLCQKGSKGLAYNKKYEGSLAYLDCLGLALKNVQSGKLFATRGGEAFALMLKEKGAGC